MSYIREGDRRYLQGLPITIISVDNHGQKVLYVDGHHEFKTATFGDLLPDQPGVVLVGGKR